MRSGGEAGPGLAVEHAAQHLGRLEVEAQRELLHLLRDQRARLLLQLLELRERLRVARLPQRRLGGDRLRRGRFKVG